MRKLLGGIPFQIAYRTTKEASSSIIRAPIRLDPRALKVAPRACPKNALNM